MGYALRRMWLPQGVASLLWNQWQLCRGMRGNFAMESVARFAWNRWQLSYGTGGNFRAEYATAHAASHDRALAVQGERHPRTSATLNHSSLQICLPLLPSYVDI